MTADQAAVAAHPGKTLSGLRLLLAPVACVLTWRSPCSEQPRSTSFAAQQNR